MRHTLKDVDEIARFQSLLISATSPRAGEGELTDSEAGLPVSTLLTLATGLSGQTSPRSPTSGLVDALDVVAWPFGIGLTSPLIVGATPPDPEGRVNAASSAEGSRSFTVLRSVWSLANAARA